MFTRCLLSAALAAAAISTAASTAAAHFVWIETQSEGSALLVRSGFGEPAGWDPDLVDRMQAVKFWRQAAGGLQPLEMKLDSREHEYRGLISGQRPAAIVASCDFGVVQFGGNPPAWLRYTAKTMIGPPSAWPAPGAEPKLRIEILPTFEAGAAALTVLHLGKPLVGAKIKCDSPKQGKLELLTDANGAARWPCADPGLYACYVGTTVPASGKTAGKEYETLKDYATLTFSVGKAD